MKKVLFCLFVSILMACMVFGLVACNDTESNNPSDDDTPQNIFDATNPYGYKVGDQIPVYPGYEFNYIDREDGEEYNFHIKSLSVTLVSINEITENSTIDSPYFTYTVLIQGQASVDRMHISTSSHSMFEKTSVAISLREPSSSTWITTSVKVNDDFSIEWNGEAQIANLTTFQFSAIGYTI